MLLYSTLFFINILQSFSQTKFLFDMKKELSIDYTNSGITTLRNASWAVLVGGIIAYLALVYFSSITISGIYSKPEFEFSFGAILSNLPVLLGAIFFYGIGFCIATIAETSLIQKCHIENQYDEEVIDNKDNSKKTHEELLIQQYKENLKDDEVIVKINHNHRIELWKISDMEESIKEGNSDKFTEIYRK